MLIAVVLALLAGRLVWLQGPGSTAYAATAAKQRMRVSTLLAPRGGISDRTGQPLAMTVDARAVYGEPRTIAKAVCSPGDARPCTVAQIAAALAPVLHTDVAGLVDQLSRSTAFVYLARGLDPAQGKAVQALDLIGVGVIAEPKRVHPGGDLAANVVGFMDGDGANGLAGVESAWGDVLTGRPGKLTAEVDGSGRVIPTALNSEVAPVPGRDVQLTLDRDLQWYAQRVLAKKVAETKAVNGSLVVMDPRTGEVLALASAPTFNPDARKRDGKDQGDPAIQDVYEPGSVNKIITAAAALESGVVTPDTVLTVPSTYRVAGHTVHDAEQHPVERLTFTGVLVKSSNVGTIKVAQKLGAQRMYDALTRFGFGSKTGLGLPGESRGIVPEVKDWSGTSIATIPIGQGVSANAVQVASVYATVANGGVRVTPNIVRAVSDGTGHLVPAPAPAAHRVIAPEVAAQLAGMLEGVVTEEGTAPLAAVPGYRVAGKTGTAQRVVNGRYQAGNYTSSFVGFAPADAPRLVVAVVLQGTGKHGYFGGATAGPVFKSAMSFALQGLQVPPTGTRPPRLRLSDAPAK